MRPEPLRPCRSGAGQGENLDGSRSKARRLNRGSTRGTREGSLGRISLDFLAPSGEPNRTVIKFSVLLEGPGTRHGIPVLSSLWGEKGKIKGL